MKNTSSTSNASPEQNWPQSNGDTNRDNKVVNEQEQQEITNNDSNNANDNDKQYNKQNENRSRQEGKIEDIETNRPGEQTNDSDETEKKISKMSM